MQLTLLRSRHMPNYIDGELWHGSQYLCSTLENPKSCLPAGIYRIIIAKCKQYSRKMPIVVSNHSIHPDGKVLLSLLHQCKACQKLNCVGYNTNLPCYCPQIKPGNGVCKRTDGSIIVGKYNVTGCLIHPKDVFERLYQMLRKNYERGNEITLTIQ